MPASFIAELILQPVFEFVFYVGGYYVGRLIVPVISVGRWKYDRLLREVPKKKLKWSGTYHLRGRQIYLTSEATAGVGVLFVVAVGGLLLLWRYAF
ncbi:MAG TPA: hypothetical protein VJA21_21095 [Verrucomicrobiae bacterium]